MSSFDESFERALEAAKEARIEAILAKSRSKIRSEPPTSKKASRSKKDPRWVGRFFRTLDTMRARKS